MYERVDIATHMQEDGKTPRYTLMVEGKPVFEMTALEVHKLAGQAHSVLMWSLNKTPR